MEKNDGEGSSAASGHKSRRSFVSYRYKWEGSGRCDRCREAQRKDACVTRGKPLEGKNLGVCFCCVRASARCSFMSETGVHEGSYIEVDCDEARDDFKETLMSGKVKGELAFVGKISAPGKLEGPPLFLGGEEGSTFKWTPVKIPERVKDEGLEVEARRQMVKMLEADVGEGVDQGVSSGALVVGMVKKKLAERRRLMDEYVEAGLKLELCLNEVKALWNVAEVWKEYGEWDEEEAERLQDEVREML